MPYLIVAVISGLTCFVCQKMAKYVDMEPDSIFNKLKFWLLALGASFYGIICACSIGSLIIDFLGV